MAWNSHRGRSRALGSAGCPVAIHTIRMDERSTFGSTGHSGAISSGRDSVGGKSTADVNGRKEEGIRDDECMVVPRRSEAQPVAGAVHEPRPPALPAVDPVVEPAGQAAAAPVQEVQGAGCAA